MSDTSKEESRHELKVIMKNRKVSPGTTILFNMIIESYDKLEELEKGSFEYWLRQMEISRQETILESRLQKDKEYYKLTLDFRVLLAKVLILRYGDYHKTNVYTLRAKCQELAREKMIEKDYLSLIPWKQILQNLKAEQQKQHDYDCDTVKPKTLTTDLINTLSTLCGIEFHHALFEIEEYVKRNDVAHSGIDALIAEGDWMGVAKILVRDRFSIENGMLPESMEDQKENLLTSLEMFKNRYFASITETVDPESGYPTALFCHLSEEELQREKAVKASKAAIEAQQMSRKLCQEVVKRARTAKWINYSLKTAQAKLLAACDEMEAKNEICKKAQADAGKATTDYKKAVMKYAKLEKGQDED
jgi:hypothetical protein